jgi:hypothetical protein
MVKRSILLFALVTLGGGQLAASALRRVEPSGPGPAAIRDLSGDEARGGHTLSRHVGKSDAELRERLRREPQISAASTYTDRQAAERTVGAALASGSRAFDRWRARNGSRPNFVLRYTADGTIGRSLARGQSSSTSCTHAVVVLRWDERAGAFYVLTSYPEENR